MMLSNYPETKAGGVAFVRDVFLSMDGIVSTVTPMDDDVTPLRRPGHNDAGYYVDSSRDAFYMDFENACLESYRAEPPVGPQRWQHPEWAAHIQMHVFPFSSDLDWQEYRDWVEAGGGDDWFQP